MLRRTKILATLGPATDDPKVLREIFLQGVDAVRINFSHGDTEEHCKRVQNVRRVSAELGIEIGILMDLQGPKIRISRFANKSIVLNSGDQFILDASLDETAGNQEAVGIDYKNLPNDVKADDLLLLDDGRITMRVKKVDGPKIYCEVVDGGPLSNNKGINRQGGGLSAEALTDKDKADIKVAAELGADYIAISFPRSAEDVEYAKQLIKESGSNAHVVSKIERFEAIRVIDEIILASHAVMVARGDLGVEIGEAEVPAVQKHIIARARALNRIVITATQMMESMITNAIPTRAEVSDVANAVLDGTDAVMLSAETATGKYPIKTVEAMARVCIGAEKQPGMRVSGHRMECRFNRVDEAIAMASMYTANHVDVKAIVSLTETGTTPLLMSRIRSGIPIYGLCRHALPRHRMKLYRGVYPIDFDVTKVPRSKVVKAALDTLIEQKAINHGDWVIITLGDFLGVEGGSNTMKLVRVGSVVEPI